MDLLPLAIGPGPAALAALPALRAALDGGPAVLPYAAGSQPAHVPPRRRARRGHRPGRRRPPARPAPRSSPCSPPPRSRPAPPPPTTASAAPAAGCSPCRRTTSPGCRCCCAPSPPGPSPRRRPLRRLHRRRPSPPRRQTLDGRPRRYTALVPTQLARLLDDPAATRGAGGLDGVLVGGAATPPRLLAQARERGIRVVTTYGMSETGGGCVYDGCPLAGSQVRIDAEQRILLGGADARHVATSAGLTSRRGLHHRTPTAPAGSAPTTPATSTTTGCWHVDGRLDDLINTGGLKVAPAPGRGRPHRP